ncbi:hypothetical protein MNBD_NITROSPINAE04-1703 [hydrothermal vent metagenome]|uniref:Uncharacterized protein n=1 Tax=hydrothermal vent metagenome TaxID=652676 RepID=A0A3B1C794_9ZZZZ
MGKALDAALAPFSPAAPFGAGDCDPRIIINRVDACNAPVSNGEGFTANRSILIFLE